MSRLPIRRAPPAAAALASTLLALAAPAAAEVAAFGCYERVYSADHLAKNPAQTVRRMAVEIGKFDGPGDTGMTAQVGMIAAFNGDKRQWAAGGGCKAQGGALSCGMDGDAGVALVRADPVGLRVEIPGYVSVEADLPNDDLEHRAIRGPAHRVFLLAPAAKAACEYKR